MTGQPAETWRKFRFSTAPAWAYLFLLLLCTGVGLLIVFILMAVVSRRASGHLPLSRTSSRTIALANWIPVALLSAAFGAWILAAIIGSAGAGSSSGASRTLTYTTWVRDANVTGGPEPGYKPAFTGLTGDEISSASVAKDQNGIGWVVNVSFTARGAELFSQLTRANVAACPGDPNTGLSANCAERHLTLWLDLTQQDIDNWEDATYANKVSQNYNLGCLATAKPTTLCSKLVVDALTLQEIDGGNIVISGGGSGFSQQAANDLARAFKPASSASNQSPAIIPFGLLVLGLLSFLTGVLGVLVVRPLIRPRGKVMERQIGYYDKLVELRNVHPAFVVAVNQMHAARAAYYASKQTTPGIPTLPGST